VTDELTSVIIRLQRQTGFTVKVVRTDHGTEYSSFDKFCRSQGIVREYSTPDCPEQNGKAERLNRAIVEKTRALLHHHNSPQVLWTEAVQVAGLLRNYTASEGQTITPFELLYGKTARCVSTPGLRLFCFNPYPEEEAFQA
jgi:transposase InsO family protein